MTDEQMRIAIAEACGWRPYKPITYDGWPLLMTPPKKPNKEGWLEPIPDYLNDLNAMHEAEELLPEEKRPNYVNNLYLVAVEHQIKTGKWRYSGLSARQRAIALIKTLNLEPK